MNKNLNAMLVFGGNSFEHDISIITALIIKNKAFATKYNLLPVYISKSNDFYLYLGEQKLSAKHFKDFEQSYKKNGFVKIYFKANQNKIYYKTIISEKSIEVSCALNCCHGGIGESGNLCAIFEQYNIPLSSGSMTALGICMDKVLSKYTFSGLSLPVIDFVVFDKKEYQTNKDEVISKIEELTYPVILKPATLGSSIGIELVKDSEDLLQKIDTALEFDSKILVEKAILEDMQEYNVACMTRGDEVLVSEVDKPVRASEILSFEDKYIGNGSKGKMPAAPAKGSKGGEYLNKKDFPAKVNEKLKFKLQSIAKEAYIKLGLQGIVRVDFITKKGKVYLNEINAVPGSLGYYFFVPKPFKTMSMYVDCLLDASISCFKKRACVKKEFVTKLI